MYKQVYRSSTKMNNFRFLKKNFFHGHEPLKGEGVMSESEFK